MRLTLTLAAALGLAGGWAAAHSHKEHAHGGHAKADGKTVTLRGEVLDMACYMSHEGRGKEHKTCAKQCLMGGAPAGLLADDGMVYLVVEDHSKKTPYKQVLELAGEKVELTGTLRQRGGLSAVVVAKVAKAK